MFWKEQKLKTLEPPENAAIVESIFAQIITSIFISELIQVNGLLLCGRGRKSAELSWIERLVLLKEITEELLVLRTKFSLMLKKKKIQLIFLRRNYLHQCKSFRIGLITLLLRSQYI